MLSLACVVNLEGKWRLNCLADKHQYYKKERRALCVENRNEARSRYHCCRREAISVTYSECVFVDSVIRRTKRMRPIILLSVACLYHIFPHHLINGRIFGGKKVFEHEIYIFFIFSANFVRNISNSKKNSTRCYHKCT